MTDMKHAAPEAKALGDAEDVAVAFDGFMTAFEAFKDANDERLSQIETNLSADVITRDKVDRISNAMDEQKRRFDMLIAKAQRPALGGAHGNVNLVDTEHKTAFEAYMRSGQEQGLRTLEGKAMSVSVDADGGYLVPDETEAEFGRRMATMSPILSIASVRVVSGSNYKKPFAASGPQVGWVAETAVRPETTQGTLAELSFPTMELYAMPAATSTLLDDAAVNVDA